VNKQTHYIVTTPYPKTKHFCTLKAAQKFIKKEQEEIEDWYSFGDDSENNKEETLRQYAQIKAIPFEVEIQQFN
jgi:hypothetical protein